jgi:23S rRNA (cytidine1920-2'-O)/16S rRNA (cytidine1409-2'-O)-methyltransferase
MAESRNVAQRLILAGQVHDDGQVVVDKPSRIFSQDSILHVKKLQKYVSRGGEKLEGFFIRFPFDILSKSAIDIGASTGGFSDYLLQNGIHSVVCVDVGHGQLHYKLRCDKRIVNLEGINARHLRAVDLPQADYDIMVMDLSFISLEKILPNVWPLLRENGLLVALIKPQFEAAKREADRGRGIIGDPYIHRRVCEKIRNYSLKNIPNCIVFGECPSPIRGSDGNCEFFLGLQRLSGS